MAKEKMYERVQEHFYQSAEWKAFQVALGRIVLSEQGNGWSWLATMRRVWQISYLSVPYGPTVLEEGGLIPALESLVKIANENKADFVRIEPMGIIEAFPCAGFRFESVEEVEPAMTSIIDLTLSEDQLRQNMASGHRNAINGAKRRGLSIKQGGVNEVVEFNRLIRLTAQKARIRVHDEKYFSTLLRVLDSLRSVRLYLAEAEGKVVAANIIFTSQSTWYYAHAASDPKFSKFQPGAPLLWQAILDAKTSGATNFDLWGVVPLGDQGPKSGYSRFKRAFGGVDKEYAGTWDLVVNPVRYKLFKLARNASRAARKVVKR